MFNALRDFLRLEAAGGIVLVIAAGLALAVANSPLASVYDALIGLPFEIRLGEFSIAKPMLLWINDGLMAIFFLLVGLELKREFLDGELSDTTQIALPALGALGGMIVPALIYAWINRADPVALQGWAIPAATDIAFALAVLALLGDRVPIALRVFLVSVAIFDDLGAILIIAVFYTSNLSLVSLGTALCCLPVLLALNRFGVVERTPYILVGAVMWAAVLKSGVHATLAGVVLALFIPMRDKAGETSPLREFEHDLHTAVAFVILPLFAFVNSGISLSGITMERLFHPVPLGILAGLFVGKQLGVFAFCWLGLKLGLAQFAEGMNAVRLYGVAVLCGVGFTMSLFIGTLAFQGGPGSHPFDERLGIIAGSLLSGVVGYLLLRRSLPAESGR